jgi:hypothetical protein
MDGEGDLRSVEERLLSASTGQGERRVPLTTAAPAIYINPLARPHFGYSYSPYPLPQYSIPVVMNGCTHQQHWQSQGEQQQQRPTPSAQQAQPNMTSPQQQPRPNPLALLEQRLLRQWPPNDLEKWQRLSQEQRQQWLAQNLPRLQQMVSPPRTTQSQATIPIDPSILTMGANGQQQRQSGAGRPSVGGPRQYAQSPPSMPGTPPRPAANTSRSPQNISRASAASPLRTGSHMPTLSRSSMSQGHVQQSPPGQQRPGGSPQIPSAQLEQQWAKASARQPAYGGPVQAPGQGQQRAPMSPPKPSTQYQQQGSSQSYQQEAASPSRQLAYHPVQQGQKRQATDQPDRPAHGEKRQAAMQPPPNPSTVSHGYAAHTNGASNVAQHLLQQRHYLTTEQRLEHEAQRHNAHLQEQARLAHRERLLEQKRTNDEFLAAQASRLERERFLRRKQELYHDPSAIYRHYDEYLKHFPLGPGESKNPYFVRLLANRPIYPGGDEEMNDAIRLAKEEWECYAQWPKDTERFKRWARDRKAKMA